MVPLLIDSHYIWVRLKENPTTDGSTYNRILSGMNPPPLIDSYDRWIHFYWDPIRDGSTPNGTLSERDPPPIESYQRWVHL
eukprot:6461448-Pyramimonas_sp.AAC.1